MSLIQVSIPLTHPRQVHYLILFALIVLGFYIGFRYVAPADHRASVDATKLAVDERTYSNLKNALAVHKTRDVALINSLSALRMKIALLKVDEKYAKLESSMYKRVMFLVSGVLVPILMLGLIPGFLTRLRHHP